MSISKTVKMKLTVFEDYHKFFKTVLDEEEQSSSPDLQTQTDFPSNGF